MAQPSSRSRKTLALSEVLASVLAPVVQRRGFALADLSAAWREVVGPRYADCTQPERIDWPRQAAGGEARGILRVRAEGPRAVLLQHELGQVVERVNAFLGYGAIDRIRLVQGSVTRRAARPEPPKAPPADEARVAEAVARVGDDALKTALARLGRGVLGDRR